MNTILKEKIEQAISILQEKNIDAWLTFVRESETIHDPVIDILIGTDVTWQSAFILTKNGDTIALVGSLDVANVKEKTNFKDVTGYVKSINEQLLKILGKINPQKIAVNFSKNSNMADGLTHGMYLVLQEIFKDSQFSNRIISSEEIVSALRGRKTEAELTLMKEAIKITEDIFRKVSGFIKPGLTEKQIADFILEQTKMAGVTPAWTPEHCPAVFSGPDTAGAHASPTERIVKEGHILNIDFGVKYKGYCSDLQRTWYIGFNNETTPPPEVLRGFNTIVESIKKSAEAIKPGKKGVEIDDVARNYIISAGYDEYPHALGHQIGRKAHDGGGLLAPRWQKYGDLPFIPIEVNQVFTIEPRLNVHGYGIATIEEEIVVRENGAEFLSSPQKEIYFIKPN